MIKPLFILFFCVICLCSGCSTTILPPDKLSTSTHSIVRQQSLTRLQNFEASGKVGFSDGKKGGNANLQWTQLGDLYQIRLYGPLGSGSLLINGNAKEVYLTQADGKIIHAQSAEELVRAELGWIIPVSGLRYWLKGLPVPKDHLKQIKFDKEQRIWFMEQQGWSITYQSYQIIQGIAVPQILMLNNGPIRLKFIFHDWRLRD